MRILLLFLISSLCISEPVDSKLELDDFIFTAEELPSGCKRKQINPGDNVPCAFQANPVIFSDDPYLACFFGMLRLDSRYKGKLKKGLFSVYMHESELGVFGIETDTNETAEAILKDLIKNDPNNDSSDIVRSGSIIIWLWQDGAQNDMFKTFKELIRARLN